jgi:hypothetical protein
MPPAREFDYNDLDAALVGLIVQRATGRPWSEWLDQKIWRPMGGQSAEVWGSLIRQLVHRGYLEQDVASYSVLRLTPAARPLLRGEERLTLARPRVKAKPLKKAARKRPGQLDYNEELFQSLRILRNLADAAGVPLSSSSAMPRWQRWPPASPPRWLQINRSAGINCALRSGLPCRILVRAGDRRAGRLSRQKCP